MKWMLAAALLVVPLQAQEKKTWSMSAEDEKQLEREKILITPNTYKRIDHAYRGTGGEFITSDTVIAAWNVLLGQSLQLLDRRCAAVLAEDLDVALKSLPTEPPEVMKREDFDAALRKARLILGVACRLDGGAWKAGDAELDNLIAEEAKRIESAQGSTLPGWLTQGEATPVRAFDYAVFKPMAAYAGVEAMERHYRTVRWLQYASLAPSNTVNQITNKLLQEATKRRQSFEVFSGTTEMLFGPMLEDEKEFARLSVIAPGRGLDVRLFEMSTTVQRPWPDPVEVMALAGMPAAGKMLASEATVTSAIAVVRSNSESWPVPLVQSYLGAMGALSDTAADDLPAFMKSEAWQRKSLNTGLAGWAQFCHATALNRGIAMSPFGMVQDPPRSFVEPNPEFFHRFGLLVSEAIQGVLRLEGQSRKPEITDEIEFQMTVQKWLGLKDLCQDLENLAHKQLRGLDLSTRDQQLLDGFGPRLGHYLERGQEADDEAPRVAVGYSRPGVGVLLVGTGRPQQILVRYPWKGKELVCHGAVLPFRSMQSDRVLSDQEWKELLDSPQAPKPPEWLKPILAK
ncbi:DUF3160 domain-containing protein [Luteolibacter sp. LG18]|uniref:DUF3160 domain-containing protein n=1 Tax=Luteolibacter sp. LG18 TaxID=2819286 RepID=UPI0030C6DF7D